MSQTGQHCLKPLKCAMNSYLASARRAVLAAASARRLHLNALHCACVKENVLRTDMVELFCIMYACHHIFIV